MLGDHEQRRKSGGWTIFNKSFHGSGQMGEAPVTPEATLDMGEYHIADPSGD